MYDLIIIGGGPAGVAAGVYAARKRMKCALITDIFGGQSLVSADIQNWIGVKSISGFDWGKQLEEHIRSQEGIDIMDGDFIERIEKINGGFRVETKSKKNLETKTILLTTGSRRRKLAVPGEEKFEGKGVAYCSICDAPLFNGKAVAVVGGGNSGLEAVRDLIPYAKSIYLLHRSDALKGDAIIQQKILSNPKVQTVLNVQVTEVLGADSVTGIRYKDKVTSDIRMLEVQGVFVEIGSLPNSDIVKDFVKRDNWGQIIVDHKTQQTSEPGIWAAGDVSDVLYKQNNISMGDAIKAVLNIYDSFKH